MNTNEEETEKSMAQTSVKSPVSVAGVDLGTVVLS